MATANIPVSGIVPASGTKRLTLPDPGGRRAVICSQVSVSAPNVGGSARCAVYLDGVQVTPLVAAGDTGAGEPYVEVRPGQRFYVEWTGATVGAKVEALFFYD